MQLYATDLFVTVNTHRTYTRQLHADLHAAIAALTDAANAQRVLGQSAEHPTIYEARIEVKEIGWELSQRQRFFHAHFVFELTHSGGLQLGPLGDAEGVGIQRRLQRYFDGALGVEGVYVHATLAPSSAAKNYMRKQQERQQRQGQEEGEEGRLLPERTIIGGVGAFRGPAAT